MTEQPPRVAAVRVHVGDEETEAVMSVLRSGRLVQGEQVAAFEEEFSSLVDGRVCVAVNSGTSALHLGLLAAGIGPGDEVIVPSFTFAATANAVAMTGATPVFADIEPATFSLDPDAVAAAVTPRTAGIIPVHLYGHPAAWDGLSAVAERHDLFLLEDAAQAHGATYGGTSVGALGDVAAFSFYATKNMTTGEGGMVVCRDDDTARRVRLLRNQGMEQRYRNEIAGLNNRMTDLAAAMGRVQLGRLPGWNDERRAVAATYHAGAGGGAHPRGRGEGRAGLAPVHRSLPRPGRPRRPPRRPRHRQRRLLPRAHPPAAGVRPGDRAAGDRARGGGGPLAADPARAHRRRGRPRGRGREWEKR